MANESRSASLGDRLNALSNEALSIRWDVMLLVDFVHAVEAYRAAGCVPGAEEREMLAARKAIAHLIDVKSAR